MKYTEIVQAWKDPEAERTEVPSPLGELDLADAFGGMVPVTSHSGEVTYCSTCGIASYGCC